MSFEAQLARFAIDTEHKYTAVTRTVAVKLFNAIIRDTPVDTGRLRGNWLVSEDEADSRVLGDEATQKSQQEIFNEVQSIVNKADPEIVLYLANNLPYVNRIEYDGWSHTKAPKGMVRKNIIRFRRLLEQAVRDIT